MNEPDVLDEPAPPPPKRRRRLLGCGLVLLVLLAACGGFYGYLLHKFDADLADAVAEADRQDPDGWRLDDIEAHRKVLPDEENAALVVQKVKNNMPAKWPLPRPAPAGGAAPVAAQAVTVEDDLGNLPPEVQLDDALLRDLRADLNAAEPARAEARKLAGLREGRFPIHYERNYFSTKINTQQVRDVARLLRHEAVLLAQEGQADKALEATRGIVVAGRSVGDEPTLISQLIRLAIEAIALQTLERVLAQGEPSAEELKRMQELLELEAAEPLLLNAARGERAGQHELMKGLTSGDVKLSTLDPPGTGEGSALNDITGPTLARTSHAQLLRWMTEYVRIARLPPEEQAEPIKALERDVKQSRAGYRAILATMLMPAFIKVWEAARREQAGLRCAIVAIAAERYRKDHGRWPEALNDLTHGYLKAVPTDPYDGKPLRWKPLPDGVIVYSVGPDLDDNGGALNRTQPLAKGIDYGFRLWDPAQRRRPPAEILPLPIDAFPDQP
jgi:hypothetical protein